MKSHCSYLAHYTRGRSSFGMQVRTTQASRQLSMQAHSHATQEEPKESEYYENGRLAKQIYMSDKSPGKISQVMKCQF